MKTATTLEHLRSITESVSLNDPDIWNALNALMRKIDIAKKLRDRYDPDWTPAAESRSLNFEEIETFCTIWQTLLERCIPLTDVATGRKLKLVNSGLKALDLLPASRAATHPLRQTFKNYAETVVNG